MNEQILQDIKKPGIYEIPLWLDSDAFRAVQELRLLGHAVTHDETLDKVSLKLIQVRVFHYKTCKVCQGYHT